MKNRYRCLLAFILLSVGMIEGTVTVLAETSIKKVNVDSHALEVVSKNIHKMNRLIVRGKDGLFHINRQANDQVSREAVELFSKGLKQVNIAIKTGEIVVNKDNTISATMNILTKSGNMVNQNNIFSTKKGIRPKFGYDVYWWGIRIYYNGNEAIKLQHALEKVNDVSVLAGLLASWIPHRLLNKATCFAVAIAAYGIKKYTRDIARVRTKAGMTIDWYWYLSVWTLPEVRGR